jgi:hypothetical protein
MNEVHALHSSAAPKPRRGFFDEIHDGSETEVGEALPGRPQI